MGEVSILQNDHGVQDMPVQKMDPHLRPCRRSSWESLYWAGPQASPDREGHAIRPRLFPCGRGFPDPSILCRSCIMYHPVPHQRSLNHLLLALPEIELSLLSLLVGMYLSYNPSPVRCLRLGPCSLSWAVDHAECLTKIGLQSHPNIFFLRLLVRFLSEDEGEADSPPYFSSHWLGWHMPWDVQFEKVLRNLHILLLQLSCDRRVLVQHGRVNSQNKIRASFLAWPICGAHSARGSCLALLDGYYWIPLIPETWGVDYLILVVPPRTVIV